MIRTLAAVGVTALLAADTFAYVPRRSLRASPARPGRSDPARRLPGAPAPRAALRALRPESSELIPDSAPPPLPLRSSSLIPSSRPRASLRTHWRFRHPLLGAVSSLSPTPFRIRIHKRRRCGQPWRRAQVTLLKARRCHPALRNALGHQRNQSVPPPCACPILHWRACSAHPHVALTA